jgi:Fe-S-cluster containining protein
MKETITITKEADRTKPLDKLEERLAGGFRFVNLMCSMNQENNKDNKAILYSLVEVLISKGLIHLHELEEREKKIIQSFGQSDEQAPRVHLMETPNKYVQDNQVIIDCKSRLPICKAICCKFWFALSVQDLEERILKWDYSKPYGIAQDQDGYCVHLDRSNFKCTIYEHRPLICRTYECRNDKRIWLDFEKMIINPELPEVFERNDEKECEIK